MPHVSFVSLSGVRKHEAALLKLGMSLPGLAQRAAAIEALPPLGVLTLAGMTPRDWSVSLHESDAATEALATNIIDDQPTLVAISAMTASILEAYKLAGVLRGHGIAVVLGGLHVTACPQEALQHADAIVVGDGEPVWLEVLHDAAHRSLQPCYKANAPFDLGGAPLPRFDLLGDRKRPRYTLQATRGCPFACEFCAASRLLGPFRTKSPERIRAELDAICALESRPFIELADDNTFARGGPHQDFLDIMSASGARWFTESDWRVGENEELLKRLAASGCVQLLIGFESLVYSYKGMGTKQTSMSRMMDAVHAIQEAGVAVIGCFIVGSDGETPESIDHLAAFLKTDPCADVQLTLQTPFPGTRLRQRLVDEGRLLRERDWSYYTLFDVTYHPDCMTPDDLDARFRQLVTDSFDECARQRRHAIRRSTWRNDQAWAERIET